MDSNYEDIFETINLVLVLLCQIFILVCVI